MVLPGTDAAAIARPAPQSGELVAFRPRPWPAVTRPVMWLGQIFAARADRPTIRSSSMWPAPEVASYAVTYQLSR
jgi:hypothetical protein